MVGYPGSGKSLVARKITQQYGCRYFSSDVIRRKEFKTSRLDTVGHSRVQSQLKKAYEIMYQQAIQKVKQGKCVVLDAPHLHIEKRKNTIQKLTNSINPKQICYVTVKTSRQLITNRMKLPRKPINKNETFFQSWHRVMGLFDQDKKKGLISWPNKDEKIDILETNNILPQPLWVSKIKMISWDIDGTLYPSAKALSQTINARLIEAVASHLKCGQKQASENFSKLVAKTKSNTKALDKLGIDGHNFFTQVWDEINLSQHIKPDPKLKQLFQQLSFLQHSILTNSNTQHHIKKKLRLLGLSTKTFYPIITSVDLKINKPDIRIFKELVRQSGLKPEQILYVGDREEVDIKPAQAVGLRSCLVYNHSSIADLSINSPHELIRYFTI